MNNVISSILIIAVGEYFEHCGWKDLDNYTSILTRKSVGIQNERKQVVRYTHPHGGGSSGCRVCAIDSARPLPHRIWTRGTVIFITSCPLSPSDSGLRSCHCYCRVSPFEHHQISQTTKFGAICIHSFWNRSYDRRTCCHQHIFECSGCHGVDLLDAGRASALLPGRARNNKLHRVGG